MPEQAKKDQRQNGPIPRKPKLILMTAAAVVLLKGKPKSRKSPKNQQKQLLKIHNL